MRKTARRGFSLIELALVLGISGLMVGFVLQSKQEGASFDCYNSTKSQLRDINGAIERFARNNSRLPMPASRSVGVEGITFGREASGGAIDTVGTTSWGALPFQALGLAPSYASDCWGNKFSYVVTTALTTNAASGGYLDSSVAGTISVRKDATNTISSTNAFAVISHGEDGLGAVKNNYGGAGHGWCGGGASLKTYNCLATSTTIANAVYNNGKDAGANYFDDLLITSGRPLVIVNGQCNNAVALGCAAGSAGSDNGLTACSTIRTWVCNGANGGTNSGTCSFNNPVCANCTATALTWGGGCSATFPATAHTATTPSTANTNPSFTGGSTATATCTNGTFSTPVGSCTAVPPPVNGACGGSYQSCTGGTLGSFADNGCGSTKQWWCNGSNGGSNIMCSVNNAACASCTSVSKSWGAGCTAIFPTTGHGNTTPAQTNTNGAYTGNATATCTNGTFAAASGTCNAVVPVNGSCNNAAPGGACAAGSVSGDNGLTACGTTRSWNCVGSNGGSTAGCTYGNAACPVNAVCSGTYQSCTAGTLGSSADYGCGSSKQWWCNGANGGANVLCSVANAACPINAVCGASYQQCSAGTLGAYADYGCGSSKQWWCNGANGGTNTLCSSANASCPVNGACGGGDNSCNAGSVFGQSYDSNRTWYCAGANGGSNSGQCRGSVCEPTANSICSDVGLGNWGGYATGAHWGNYCTGGAPRWVSVTACCIPGGYQNQSYNWNGVMVPGCDAPVVAVNGVCGNTRDSCSAGTLTGQYGEACEGGFNFTWTCAGSGGGSDANCFYRQNTCFIAGTRITMADGTTKRIEELKVGDMVKGQTRDNPVLRVPDFDKHTELYGFNAREPFVTGGHPFFTQHGWKAFDPSQTPKEGHNVKTTKLEVGDVLTLDNGKKLKIKRITQTTPADHRVYSPTVGGDHTYYSNHVLVHNKDYSACQAF